MKLKQLCEIMQRNLTRKRLQRCFGQYRSEYILSMIRKRSIFRLQKNMLTLWKGKYCFYATNCQYLSMKFRKKTECSTVLRLFGKWRQSAKKIAWQLSQADHFIAKNTFKIIFTINKKNNFLLN
jgi:hypothetical protein